MVAKIFWRMPALMLVFGLALAACDNGVQEVNGEVNLPRIANPVVTASAVGYGVSLSWPAIIDASAYSLFRSSSGQDAPVRIAYVNGSPDENGLYWFYDVVTDDNLKSATEYTYTLIAYANSSTMDNGRWDGTVTTGTLPARGSKLAAPSAVALELDAEKKTITVQITPRHRALFRLRMMLLLPGMVVTLTTIRHPKQRLPSPT